MVTARISSRFTAITHARDARAEPQKASKRYARDMGNLLGGRIDGFSSSRRGIHTVASAQAALGVPAQVTRETFTNLTGKVITPIRDNVWKVDRPFVYATIDVGSCMTVIKLQDGSLWVHSPVWLDKILMDALAELGPVKHIVSPNYEHLKFAAQWIDAYPDATSYACPGLIELHPEIPYSTSVGVGNSTPSSWPSEIEVTHLDFEVNPFNGKPFFSEVLFCHTPSKTCMITDFFWNWPADAPWRTRTFNWGMDVLFKPFYFNYMIKDPEAYTRAMDRLLGQGWDAIIPCHGHPIFDDAKGVLKRFADLD